MPFLFFLHWCVHGDVFPCQAVDIDSEASPFSSSNVFSAVSRAFDAKIPRRTTDGVSVTPTISLLMSSGKALQPLEA